MRQREIHIRKYESADRNKVIELLRLNTPTYFAPDEEKDLHYYLDNHLENYFVLETDGQLVGCGGFNTSDRPETIRISWDIIHPEYHGKGLGKELTTFRIQQIKTIKGVNTIVVRTSQLVYPFYEKQGFQLREVVQNYWAEGFDLYRMECDIRSL
ncbi:MAG: GNAT family N-acetyltransferase [Spirosomataceae bacterium]